MLPIKDQGLAASIMLGSAQIRDISTHERFCQFWKTQALFWTHVAFFD